MTNDENCQDEATARKVLQNGTIKSEIDSGTA